jgi:uncharacterized membrane protein
VTAVPNVSNETSPSLKRPAEPHPSITPSKQPKLQDVKPTPTAEKEPVNPLEFLKSRLQIASTNKKRAVAAPTPLPQLLQSPAAPKLAEESQSTRSSKAKVSGKSTAIRAGSSSWEQQHETVLEFLRRLPVASPATADVGPWLWVQCPRELRSFKRNEDLEAFVEVAMPLLDGLSKQRTIIEQQNPDKAVGTITRKMGPYRDQLQVDILNAATKHDLTSGKWMLFPKFDDLPLVWRQVAEATADGQLGPTSKVGTWEDEITAMTKGTLICVFTRDFSDLADVKRVLGSLHDLGIANKGVTIYYKCDAYTHLSIMSGNSYKLQPSLWSSEEVRNDKVKYKDGLICRVKAKSGAIEEFLNS